MKVHFVYAGIILTLIALIIFAVFGGIFAIGMAFILTPVFYGVYWYIAFIPFVLGLLFSLYYKKFSYVIWGLVLTLPVSFIGSLLYVMTHRF